MLTGQSANERKKKKKTPWLCKQAKNTDRATAIVCELVPTFADRGCRVVSAKNPYGRIMYFLDKYRRK
jgi:hypothetical protein